MKKKIFTKKKHKKLNNKHMKIVIYIKINKIKIYHFRMILLSRNFQLRNQIIIIKNLILKQKQINYNNKYQFKNVLIK